jgi:hypothetical protein
MNVAPILLGAWIVSVVGCAVLAWKAWRLTRPFQDLETTQLGGLKRRDSRLHIWLPFAMGLLGGGGLVFWSVRQGAKMDLWSASVLAWLALMIVMQAGWLRTAKQARARREARS